AFHFEGCIRQGLDNLLLDLIACVQGRADRDIILVALLRLLDERVLQIERLERFAHLMDRHILSRAQRHQISAAKIDSEIPVAADVKGGASRDQKRKREHAGEKTFTEKVDVLW